jgi:hypothetical protein
MKRRDFITLVGGAVVTQPLIASAQRSDKVPKIGYLGAGFNFQPLAVGAGGQISGLAAAPDGTIVCWCDTFGAYILDKTVNPYKWRQLCTTSRLPSSAWSVPLSAAGVWGVAIAPNNTQVMYMAYGQFSGASSYMYVSTNQGATWVQTPFLQAVSNNGDQPGRFVGPKIAVDPVNPDVCIVTTRTNGTYQTTNGRSGASSTWTRIAGIAANNSTAVGCAAFLPGSGTTGGQTNVALVSVSGTGLYARTTPSGSWSLVAGAPNNINRIKVAADGITSYFVSNDGSLSKCVYNGGSFTVGTITPRKLAGNVNCVICDPNNAAHVTATNYQGFFQDSTDAGASWSAYNTDQNYDFSQIPYHATIKKNITGINLLDCVADPSTNPVTLYGSAVQSVMSTTYPMQSSGTAQHWIDVGNGIEQLAATCVCVPPGYSPLLASYDIALLQDTNPPNQNVQTQKWDTGRYLNAGHWIDYASTSQAAVVAMVGGFPNWGPENSCFSSDGGNTWTKIPAFPGTSFANEAIACSTPTNWVWQPQNGTPYYTTNGGTSWMQLATLAGKTPATNSWINMPGWSCRVAADRVNGGTFYMQNIGSGTAGTYVTTNGGATWTYFANNIDQGKAYGYLKVVPGNAGHLFYSNWSGSGGGFVVPTWCQFSRSTNGGQTWSRVTGFYCVFAFGFGAAKPGNGYPAIYVYGYYNGQLGMWRSVDAASTWQLLSNGYADNGMYPDGWPDAITDVTGDMSNYGWVYFSKQGSGFGVGNYP